LERTERHMQPARDKKRKGTATTDVGGLYAPFTSHRRVQPVLA